MSPEDSNPTEFMDPRDDAIREAVKGLLAKRCRRNCYAGPPSGGLDRQPYNRPSHRLLHRVIQLRASLDWCAPIVAAESIIGVSTGRMAAFTRFRQYYLVAALLSLIAFIIGFGIAMFGVLRP